MSLFVYLANSDRVTTGVTDGGSTKPNDCTASQLFDLIILLRNFVT
jgi:hypothetical protein